MYNRAAENEIAGSGQPLKNDNCFRYNAWLENDIYLIYI
jgi:hypothetical protein